MYYIVSLLVNRFYRFTSDYSNFQIIFAVHLVLSSVWPSYLPTQMNSFSRIRHLPYLFELVLRAQMAPTTRDRILICFQRIRIRVKLAPKSY